MIQPRRNLNVSKKNFVSSVLFGAVLLGPGYLSPDLQAISDKPFTFNQQGEVFLLKLSAGVAYLVHPLDPQNPTDELRVRLKSGGRGKLEIIANATTTGNYSYEFLEELYPSSEFKKYRFSLRHPFYKNARDFALKFTLAEDAEITFKEISLARHTTWQRMLAGGRDYFRTAPYSGFTVNVFPTPRIYGQSAFYYFLPIFIVLFLLALFSAKYRKKALVGLLILWLVTDLRMNYEFANYQIQDYKTWVKPVVSEKTLRTYGDFYVFAEWLQNNLPQDRKEITFYYLDNEHFPRLLQYYVYPVRVLPKTDEAKVVVVYHRQDIKAKLLSEGAREIIIYDEDSGIFEK